MLEVTDQVDKPPLIHKGSIPSPPNSISALPFPVLTSLDGKQEHCLVFHKIQTKLHRKKKKKVVTSAITSNLRKTGNF